MSPSPTALLQRWYALVREKRATRQDFLKALVKVFDVELNAKPSQVRRLPRYDLDMRRLIEMQDEVDFVRYMSENFAAFDYKTQEEVLTVLKYLTAVLSTTGMQLVETLSPSHLLAQLHAPVQGDPAPVPAPDQPMVSVCLFDACLFGVNSCAGGRRGVFPSFLIRVSCFTIRCVFRRSFRSFR